MPNCSSRASRGFNPRPCARGDLSGLLPGVHEREVSTHAPVRGATRAGCDVAVRYPCFNPRPCARGDDGVAFRTRSHRRFNPRPCARGDEKAAQAEGLTVVSTHAPARGATDTAYATFLAYMFQPTPLCEGRRTSATARLPRACFNPRPCARGDACYTGVPVRFCRFQPTPLCEGRPRNGSASPRSQAVSTHAPVRGATPEHDLDVLTGPVSTHAPVRGATRLP